jgi:hypothetical protein
MKGALGFVTLACQRDEGGNLMFAPAEFLYNLCCFLGFVARFYRNDGYRGDCLLKVALDIPATARVVESKKTPSLLNTRRLFTDPLHIVAKGSYSWVGNINLHGHGFGEQLLNTVDEVMLAIARKNGNLLSSTFRDEVQPIVNDVLACVTSS